MLDKIKNLEFTEDGYLISNGCYLGAKGDEFDWYGNYDLCKQNLDPIININVLDDILEYTEFVKNS